MMKIVYSKIWICLLLPLLIVTGNTGCSKIGLGRSEQHFTPKIESAFGDFEKNAPHSHRQPAAPAQALAEMTAPEHEKQGDMAYARKELANAYVHYEKSLEKDPGNHRIMQKQGKTLLAGGLNQKAAEAFRNLTAAAPDYAPAYEGLGLALLRENSPDEAVTAFNEAVTLDPGLWKSHTYLGMIHDARQNYDQAINAHTEAIRTGPRNEATHYNNLGVSYYRSGNYQKAATVFQDAINKGLASDRIYNNLGRALGQSGHYDQALAAFQRGGNRSQAYNNLGCVYLDKGNYEEAIASFKKAIVARPEYYATAGENLKHAREARQNRANRSNMDNTGSDIPINPEE